MKINIESDILKLTHRILRGTESLTLREQCAEAIELALAQDHPNYEAMAGELLGAVGLATGAPSGSGQVPTWDNIAAAKAALATVVPVLGERVDTRRDPVPPRPVILRWVEADSDSFCMDQGSAIVPPKDARVRLPDGRLAKVASVEYDFTGSSPVAVVRVTMLSSDRTQPGIPMDWAVMEGEDAACCWYGITTGSVHVWADADGINIGSSDPRGSRSAPFDAVRHVLGTVALASR